MADESGYAPLRCTCTAIMICEACNAWNGRSRATERKPRRKAPRATCLAHRHYQQGCVRCLGANRAYQRWRARVAPEAQL